VGLHVPRRVHTEESKEGFVRTIEDASWRSFPWVCRAQGASDRGGQFDGRSRALDDCDTAEICGVHCGGVHHGEKRDATSVSLW